MTSRKIHRSDGFDKQLKQLAKKHRELPQAVSKALDHASGQPVPPGDLIPGLGGAPVYKERIAFGNTGKRGGARLISYCGEALIAPLFIYVKGDTDDIPKAMIAEALAAAGLIAPVDR